MKAFDYQRAADAQAAVALVAGRPGAAFLGGGTNLVDHMKLGIASPDLLVDVTRLPFDRVEERGDGGVRVGATVRNSDLAAHPLVRRRYPVLSQALVAGASGQLRNLATTGGNLLQRTRCYYFRDPALPCNKRTPGSGCGAIDGYNRIHAVLGGSEHCIATHPSDMCVALAALDAVVEARSASGVRSIALAEFHRLPGTTPERDTELRHGELITAVLLPPSPFAAHSHYLKVRDRASYEFALVSAAVGLDIRDRRVREARIALGGVAHKPWRARSAERTLIGHVLDDAAVSAAAAAATEGARAQRDNAFKVTLAQRTVARALRQAGASA